MLDADFLEPERLRAFVAVAEMGSFSRAAERLRLAQPTVSIQVRRLEESVGYPLLERRTTSAVLTKAGETMLAYARDLLEIMARARLQFSQPPLEGSVRLGLVEDFNFGAFSEILDALRRRHSRFELFVRIDDPVRLHEQLRTDGLDMVLSKRLGGGTTGEFICRQRMAWVGRPEALQGEDDVIPLALTPPGTVTRDLVLRTLRGTGRRWSIRFEAPSVTGLHAAVLAGIGVTAFGVGVIPPGLDRLPPGVLPFPLPDVEFTLSLNPESRDAVVATFADVVRRIVPMIIGRMDEEQREHSSEPPSTPR